MTYSRIRQLRHASRMFAAALLPALVAAGCSSATSGHAPGVAGGETPIAGLTNYPLAYVKRPLPAADIDDRDLITSTPGGDLYVRDQASAGGVETNVTKSITGGLGDVKDLDVSPDGKKLVFSLRLPLIKNATAAMQPTWKIYQYDALAKTVTQLTNDDVTRGHDVGAHYLPDGRIVFASTRQTTTQAVLLDEGRPQYPAQTDVAADTAGNKQPIFLLHVMNGDGTGIHQISFNTDHDFAPSVLNNGQIVFSRWEIVNGLSQISLYRTNPDGTGLELYYGANSHATGAHQNADGTISNTNVIQFLNARQRPDGKVFAIARPFLGTQQGGDILSIDADHYVEYDQTAPSGAPPAVAGQSSATLLGVTTDANKPSPGGRFASVYPLYDGTNRMLVSWSPCLVQDTSVTPAATVVCTTTNTGGATVQQAPPQYTIWIYDPSTSTLSPLLSAEPGMMIVDPVILQSRVPVPTFIPDAVPAGRAQTLADGNLGLLVIRSVYDFDGVDKAVPGIAAVADPKQTTADQRPYRFVRIQKPVEIPDMKVRKINDSAFGPAGMGMREILEYAPVQPDGSIQIEVPANVPFTVDVLDKNARRHSGLPLHTSWMQVMPGETRTCNGCHTANVPNGATPSHGRTGLTVSVNPGAGATGVPFPDTLAMWSPDVGETMAATLARISCQSAAQSMPQGMTSCAEVPSPNVVYTDVWTDALKAGRGPFPPIDYLYSDLMTAAPVNANCLPAWDAICRITIHYPLHIQPMWTLPRQTVVAGTVTTDHTCVLCHNTVSAANAPQLPAGELDLTGGASSDDPTVVTSYRQLLFPRIDQQLNMGALQPVLVPAPGPIVNGQPTTILVPAPQLAPPMVAGSAAASSTFLRIFDGSYQDPVLDHTGFLSPAELRLISEWLDIGAQYYNDPFVAPAAN